MYVRIGEEGDEGEGREFQRERERFANKETQEG